MPRRVHQVENIGLAVQGCVFQANGLGFDRDPPLALNVHGIEHLLLHLTVIKTARDLDQAVGEGGFPMVDVSDDGEIANFIGRRCHGRLGYSPARRAGQAAEPALSRRSPSCNENSAIHMRP